MTLGSPRDDLAAANDASLREYYARRASEYERIYAKPERQADLAALRAAFASAFAGRRVLEIACGTGYWTPILATTAASVDACDINEETLAIARSKPVDSSRVRFAIGDAYRPPLFDPRPNAAFAGFWWSHVPRQDVQRFLAGLHRALADGARIVFLDNRYVEGSSTPVSRTDADRNTYQSRTLSDGSQHEVLKNFPTADELRAAVEPHAREVRVNVLDYYWWLDYTLA